MTNAQRTAQARTRRVHQALAILPGRTHCQLARAIGLDAGTVLESLSALAEAGQAHAEYRAQYPGGPAANLWYPGQGQDGPS